MRLEFTRGLFEETNTMLAEVLKDIVGGDAPRVLLVADQNVVQRTEGLGTRIGAYIQKYGIALASTPVVLSGNEKIKTDDFNSLRRILHATVSAKMGVNDVMVVLGGGSLFDVAGFAAAGVRGGMKLVKIPTTVAAMLEAAHVETAALDTPDVKDAFRMPVAADAVLVDPSFAITVLDGVWRAGLAEAVRFAAASDSRLYKKLQKLLPEAVKRDMTVFSELVEAVVRARVKKGGTTLGLWSAHRLEAMSGYKLPHGYAVAIGTAIDFRYAAEKGLAESADADSVLGMLKDIGALDAIYHAHHVLTQPAPVLNGLDAWLLSNPAGIELPTGLGKVETVAADAIDRETFARVIESFA